MIKNYRIKDICPNCALKLETALEKIDGIDVAKISVLSEKLSLTFVENPSETLLKQMIKTCKKIEPDCTVILD